MCFSPFWPRAEAGFSVFALSRPRGFSRPGLIAYSDIPYYDEVYKLTVSVNEEYYLGAVAVS